MGTRSHPDMRSAAKIITLPHWMSQPKLSPDQAFRWPSPPTSAHSDAMKRALVLGLIVLLGLSGSPATAAVPRWSWPLPAPHALSRQYLAPATPYGPGHRGLDISAATDSSGATEIRAPADGVVHFAGVVVDRPVLSIAHAGGLLSSYEPVATTLAAGDTVARGDVIGTLEPGHCHESLCLHFGVRLNGEYVNPLLLLGGLPRSILLPTR